MPDKYLPGERDSDQDDWEGVTDQERELHRLQFPGLTLAENLDSLTIEELDQMSLAYTMLAQYARDKASAIKIRAMGHIDTAQQYERDLDDTYGRIPKWARSW